MNPIFTAYTSHYPTFVEIETTSRCNINPPCPMCERAYRDTSQERDMPDYIVHKCKPILNNAETVSIFGIGEPLYDDRFEQFVNISADKIVFLSNGQIMNDNHIEIILKKPVHSILFSLDAASPHTYKKIRGYNIHTFDKVISNIEKLINAKKDRGLFNPVIKLAMVVMHENFHEIPSFIELAAHLGANGVSMWPLDHSDHRKFNRGEWEYEEKEQVNIPEEYMKSIIEYGKQLHIKNGFTLDWRTRGGSIE